MTSYDHEPECKQQVMRGAVTIPSGMDGNGHPAPIAAHPSTLPRGAHTSNRQTLIINRVVANNSHHQPPHLQHHLLHQQQPSTSGLQLHVEHHPATIQQYVPDLDTTDDTLGSSHHGADKRAYHHHHHHHHYMPRDAAEAEAQQHATRQLRHAVAPPQVASRAQFSLGDHDLMMTPGTSAMSTVLSGVEVTTKVRNPKLHQLARITRQPDVAEIQPPPAAGPNRPNMLLMNGMLPQGQGKGAYDRPYAPKQHTTTHTQQHHSALPDRSPSRATTNIVNISLDDTTNSSCSPASSR